jgi:hypothetical protein
MSSRGVFRIIGGRGAYISAVFEDSLSLKDFWVRPEYAEFAELIAATDAFTGFIPVPPTVRAEEGLSMRDGWVLPQDTLALGEGFGAGDSFQVLTPAVRQGIAVSALNRVSDEFGVPKPSQVEDGFGTGDAALALAPDVYVGSHADSIHASEEIIIEKPSMGDTLQMGDTFEVIVE